jgi:hypothetical protein
MLGRMPSDDDLEFWKEQAARYKRERDETRAELENRSVRLAQVEYELGRLQRAVLSSSGSSSL